MPTASPNSLPFNPVLTPVTSLPPLTPISLSEGVLIPETSHTTSSNPSPFFKAATPSATGDDLEDWLAEETASTVPSLQVFQEDSDSDEEASPQVAAVSPSPPSFRPAHIASATPALPPTPIITSLTLDDFNFLETQSGLSSADGEAEKKPDTVNWSSMLTPSSSLCDISESSDRSADTKKKSKKKKKETEEEL